VPSNASASKVLKKKGGGTREQNQKQWPEKTRTKKKGSGYEMHWGNLVKRVGKHHERENMKSPKKTVNRKGRKGLQSLEV